MDYKKKYIKYKQKFFDLQKYKIENIQEINMKGAGFGNLTYNLVLGVYSLFTVSAYNFTAEIIAVNNTQLTNDSSTFFDILDINGQHVGDVSLINSYLETNNMEPIFNLNFMLSKNPNDYYNLISLNSTYFQENKFIEDTFYTDTSNALVSFSKITNKLTPKMNKELLPIITKSMSSILKLFEYQSKYLTELKNNNQDNNRILVLYKTQKKTYEIFKELVKKQNSDTEYSQTEALQLLSEVIKINKEHNSKRLVLPTPTDNNAKLILANSFLYKEICIINSFKVLNNNNTNVLKILAENETLCKNLIKNNLSLCTLISNNKIFENDKIQLKTNFEKILSKQLMIADLSSKQLMITDSSSKQLMITDSLLNKLNNFNKSLIKLNDDSNEILNNIQPLDKEALNKEPLNKEPLDKEPLKDIKLPIGVEIISTDSDKSDIKTSDGSLGGNEIPYRSFPLMTPGEFKKNPHYNPTTIRP